MDSPKFKFSEQILSLATNLKVDSESSEAVYVEWMSRYLDLKSLNSLLVFAENKNYQVFFLKSLNVYSELKNDPFAASPSFESLVKSLGNFWRRKDIPDVYSLFKTAFESNLSQDVVFENEFETVLYSHSTLVTSVVFVVAILSAFEVTKQRKLDLSFFFQEFKEYPLETRQKFEKELRLMFSLYLQLSAVSEERSGSSKTVDFSHNSSKFVDKQSLRKIEELERTIDALNARVKSLEEANAEAVSKLESLERENSEKANEIRQLRFSKDDLLEKLKSKKLEFMNEIAEEKDAEIQRLRTQVDWLQTDQRNKARLFDDEKDDLHKKIHLLENFKKEYEAVKAQSEKALKAQSNEVANRLTEEIRELRERLARCQESSLADKQNALNSEMTIHNLNMELHSLKMEKQNLEFQIKDTENNQLSIVQSELYASNLDETIKELSCSSELRQLEEFVGDSDSLNKEVSRRFQSYERKCVSRVRALAKQLAEQEEAKSELAKENASLKEELSDAHDRMEFLEAKQVDKIVASPAIQEALRRFDPKLMEGGELAQDLFKTILKREQEIIRLKANQRRFNNQILTIEGRCLDNMTLIYSLVEGTLAANGEL